MILRMWSISSLLARSLLHSSIRCSISLNFRRQNSFSSAKLRYLSQSLQGESRIFKLAYGELGGLMEIELQLLGFIEEMGSLSSVSSLSLIWKEAQPSADLSVKSSTFLLLLRAISLLLVATEEVLFSFCLRSNMSQFSPLLSCGLQLLPVLPLESKIFLNHCKNSRLSWYLHLTSFSTSMFLRMPSLVKLCCRILKLETNSQSNLAFQLTLASGILLGQSTSVSWQQIAPVPNCSILERLVLSSSFTQLSSSPRDIQMALLEFMVISLIIFLTVILQQRKQALWLTASGTTRTGREH